MMIIGKTLMPMGPLAQPGDVLSRFTQPGLVAEQEPAAAAIILAPCSW